MERMHGKDYWGFMSHTHPSKYGKDASLLGLHVMSIHSSKYGNWGFMSIHTSKYGKDASLLELHVHTLQ